MSAAALLQELRRRGVELRARDGQLLYRPADALPPQLREQLRANKAEILRTIVEQEPALERDGYGIPVPLLAGVKVLAERQEPVAWRLYSRLLKRDLWVCRDARTRDGLVAEFPGVPMLTLDEVPHLRCKPPELLRAVLDIKAEFPDAGLRE